MKKLLLLFTLLSFAIIQAKDDIVIKQNVQSLVQHGDNEGKNFFVAFPLNDMDGASEQNLAIYITSRFDTEVTLSNESIGFNITQSVSKYEITSFSTVEGTFGWNAEINDFEEAIAKGFNITSKDPIKVYAMNSKLNTSEGYMAAPVRKWGTDYIHNCFYDFKEQADPRDWGSGFVVLASEDDTEVTIDLIDGANKTTGFGETKKGKQHGDQIKVTLDRGEVYVVQGNGKTRAIFDLSGSQISADKPIGLLSYHNRTMIPAIVVTNGRDHLLEMIPPVSSWGTEYHSVEIDRKRDKGDFYRVVAGENNVTFDVTWYDKETKDSIGHLGPITLQEKGDWFEYNNVGVEAPHDLESIRGVAHFESDKPMLVAQYSYSANFDGADGNYDPFMIVLPAVDQYTKDCIFQTPTNYTNDEFRNNFVNLIVKGDPSDSVNNYNLLKTLEMDKAVLLDKYPDLESNNIPGSDYYWISINDLNQGVHRVNGDTEFGATIYGFAGFDAYGWPVTHNIKDLVNTDTTSPGIVLMDDSDEYIFKVDDRVNNSGLSNPQSEEYSVGLNSMPQLKSGSFNFTEPEYVNSEGSNINLPKSFNQQLYFFSIEVIDKNQNATAILKVLDKNYNETEVAIYYTVPDYTVEVANESIIKGRVGIEANTEFSITNNATEGLMVNNIYFPKNSEFDLGEITLPIEIEPESEFVWNINFTPTDEYQGSVSSEVSDDIGIIAEEGAPKLFKIKGIGVNPEVNITNMSFSPALENSGIYPEKGVLLIENISKTWFDINTPLVISSIAFDETSPDANIFTNLRLSTGESISEVGEIVLDANETLELHFDLNTDLAEVPGKKFARLEILSDAGPADENGQIPVTANNYGVEFDGNFTADNPTALDDGGYIQVEIIEDTQSSVDDVTEREVKILNPRPITGSELNLELSEHQGTVITLSDIEGNELNSFVTDKSQVSIDVSNLANGVYFINVSNGKSQVTKKFMIER